MDGLEILLGRFGLSKEKLENSIGEAKQGFSQVVAHFQARMDHMTAQNEEILARLEEMKTAKATPAPAPALAPSKK
jgi:hypothetical protein